MLQGVYKRNLLVPFLKMSSDAAAVFLAVIFSYYLRFHSPMTAVFPVTKGYPALKNYLYFAVFLMLLFLGLFAALYSYRSRFFSHFTQEIPVILKICLLGVLLAMSGAFLYRGFSYSRLVFLLIYLNSNIFLLFSRFVFHRLKGNFLRKGFNVLKVGLIGSPNNLRQVYKRLMTDSTQNFRVTGYFCEEHLLDLAIPYIGKPAALGYLMENQPSFEGLIISFHQQDHQRLLEVLRATEGRNLELFYVPDVLDILTSRVRSLEIGGIPLLQLKAMVLSGWQGFLKRGFDMAVSGLSLFLLSPLLLLIAVLITLTSPGPVFYVQRRVGLDGREFKMLKFRSMRVDAEARTGPVWAKKGDPRATPVGRVLRRTSLDELPQLINVLKGEMSLVGPRPERKVFVEQFRRYVPQYLERQRVRSGMTGWAQVNGLRGQSPIEERTRYDLYYIENWSLLFDLKIIILTFLEIMRGENAY